MKVIEQDEQQVTAHFAGGHVEKGHLLIGADGIHSVVRQKIAGDVRLRYCGYAAYRGMIESYPSHFQQYCSTEMWGTGKRFGLFPSGRNSLYWFATLNCPEKRAAGSQDRKNELVEAFADWGSPVQQILEQTADTAILRHPIYDLPGLPHWTKGRVVLLGDAAHAMTPNFGQGACQAIEDSGTLSDCIEREQPIEQVLKIYERLRKPRAQKIVAQSYRMGQVSQWSHPVLCSLRNQAFSFIPNFIKLKQLERVIDRG